MKTRALVIVIGLLTPAAAWAADTFIGPYTMSSWDTEEEARSHAPTILEAEITRARCGGGGTAKIHSQDIADCQTHFDRYNKKTVYKCRRSVQIPVCTECRRDSYAAFLSTASCVLVGTA